VELQKERAIKRPGMTYMALWLALGFLLIAIIAGGSISAYVGWSLTHPDREQVVITPDSVGLKYQDVEFTSREDGLTLSGWLIRAEANKKTIIFAHGYGKNRLQDDVPIMPITQSLVGAGYNVLLFDFRGCGQSEGDLVSVGQFEVLDLLGAIDYVKCHTELNPRIILFGFSMGASTAILAGAREQAVDAVIADSPFADLKSYLMQNLSVWINLPPVPFNRAFLLVVSTVTGLKAEAVSPVVEVGNLGDRPLFLIHGTGDAKIPMQNSELLYETYPGAELWEVPEAGHVKSYSVAGDLYIERILEFIR